MDLVLTTLYLLSTLPEKLRKYGVLTITGSLTHTVTVGHNHRKSHTVLSSPNGRCFCVVGCPPVDVGQVPPVVETFFDTASHTSHRAVAPRGQSSQRDAQRLTLHTILPATGFFSAVAIFTHVPNAKQHTSTTRALLCLS